MDNATCAWDECDRAASKRAYCDRCYKRARKAGLIPTGPRTALCADCGGVVVGGKAGAVPLRCTDCKRKHHAAYMRARHVPVEQFRVCVDCGDEYPAPGRDTKSLRCLPCRKAARAEQRQVWAGVNPEKRNHGDPAKAITYVRNWQVANPEKVRQIKRKWYEANKDKVKAYKHRRRVLARDVAADHFVALDIFERDGWICQICGLHLDPEVKFPSNDSPSIDHIIPIALGGTHTLANVQAACMGCNRRKGGRRIA
jgi:5-methylcytosine-specific restriction endonuclease McrA